MTPEIEALLEQLRNADAIDWPRQTESDCEEAADTIEALSRELAMKDEALRALRFEARCNGAPNGGPLHMALLRADAALTPKASADEQEKG